MDRRDRNYVEKGILNEIKRNPSLQETLEGEAQPVPFTSQQAIEPAW